MYDLAFAAILASVGAFLLWLFWALIYAPRAAKAERSRPRFVKDSSGTEREKGVGVRTCPVCNEKLAVGMLVRSKVFTSKSMDKIMQIYGCPYCWPENTQYPRLCPVCEKIVPRGGYLIARYFEHPERRHVHVLGCSGCKRL
ncbi:hypothetical protein MASR2M29_15170 [Spirochaetota bacterium]